MIALRARRKVPVVKAAWTAAILAYAGLWGYRTAEYGLSYASVAPWWLNFAMATALGTAVALTFVIWWRMRKRLPL